MRTIPHIARELDAHAAVLRRVLERPRPDRVAYCLRAAEGLQELRLRLFELADEWALPEELDARRLAPRAEDPER